MGNQNRKVYRRTSLAAEASTFTVPAGVTKLKVVFQTQHNIDDDFDIRVAVDKYGTMYGWGTAEVGDGTNTSRSTPQNLNDGLTMPARAPYLLANGAMVNWGDNDLGQVGDGTVIDKSTPTLVSGSHCFRKIYRGNLRCLGLTEGGELYAWGWNANGQLGDGTVSSRSTPVLVQSGVENFWVDKVSGNQYSTFSKTSGGIYAWGLNTSGELGINDSVAAVSTPTLVTGSDNLDFIKIDHRYGSGTIGLTADGDVYCWGPNTRGQLGDNTTVSKSTPTLVSGLSNVRDVGAGTDFMAALTDGGDLYMWGKNTNGELGIGNVVSKSTPTLVSSLSQVRKIRPMSHYMFAIDKAGQAYSWGFNNASGLLGVASALPKSTPTLLAGIGNLKNIKDFLYTSYGAGGSAFAVMTTDGKRYQWGAAYENGTTTVGVSSPGLVGSSIAWALPEKTSIVHEVEVTPGDVFYVRFGYAGFHIPELGLESLPTCDQCEIHW